jgi:hypothetical protein
MRQYGETLARTFVSPITTKTLPVMNIIEQLVAIVAIAVSGAGIRTVFSAVAIRRRIIQK